MPLRPSPSARNHLPNTSTNMAETTTPTYTIRYAVESDVPTILALIRELAVYEKSLDDVLMTEAKLLATLSFPTAPGASTFTPGYAKTLLVTPTDDGGTPGEVAGIALFFNNYSTWRGPGIYLEDLFVRPQYRGKGLGKALLSALAREVRVLNPEGRLEWSVLKWNTPSIDFYRSDTVGAELMEGWVGCRVEGDGVGKLAGRR